MIEFSTAVSASIIGAVVAGVISMIVNVLSLGGQYLLNRRHREWMEQFQWRRETTAVVRQLRREALRLDVKDSDTDTIDQLIEDLESHLDSIPTVYSGTDVNSALDNIRIAYRDYNESDSPTAIVDLRTDLMAATESAERKLEDQA